MSVSHGYRTMSGIEYNDGGYVEKTKKEKVSHQQDGDDHRLMLMQGVGIAMQRMH